MRAWFVSLATLLVLVAGICRAAEPSPQTYVRYKYLETELSLASKDKFYVVFDLEKKVIQLKARGSVFRTWPVEKIMQFGEEIPFEVLSLQQRSHGSENLRVRIQPPEPEKDESAESTEKQKKPKLAELAKNPDNPAAPQNITAPKFDALELVDMPFNYELTFEKNVVIKVSADDPKEEKSFTDRFTADAKETYRLYKLKKSMQKQTLLTFKMSQADARALYWAMGDSMNALFWATPR